MTATVGAELGDMLAANDERARVRKEAGLDPLAAATLIFSAKECLFKALFPRARVYFDFRDCVLTRIDPAERRFEARLAPPFALAFGAAEFAGRYALFDGAVWTGLVEPPQRAVSQT
jgi:4'-phosphopantetheinyl transferase EntD